MNTPERHWGSQTAATLPVVAKSLWPRVSITALPVVLLSLLAVLFPTYIGQHFVLLAVLGSTLLLCFPLEPQLSFADAREPSWWNIRVANDE